MTAVCAACGLLFALGGCSGGAKPKETESDLLVMLTMLPGRYDNSAQAELDVRNNVHPAHEAVQLNIVHVFTPETRDYYRLEQLWGEAPARAVGAGSI